MKRVVFGLVLVGVLLAAALPAHAQDYRGRLQGVVTDSTQGTMPGVIVTLTNDATGVAVERVTDAQGRYLFDFVEPGAYSVSASLTGFKKASQQNIRMQQQGNVTVDLVLAVGSLEEVVNVTIPPVAVQFRSSTRNLTFERQLVDQAPIPGRNPYNLSMLDPTVTLSPAAFENRPYHHAYANDYDAGGGTRRANDVLLDGVPLAASFKTAYTPTVDAVEEITVSKNSVDAENGHSLGGIISLNMKSGTNAYKGSAYMYFRDPRFNSVADPTLTTPVTRARKGTELRMAGGTLGMPIKKNKIFSFTSFEQWDDKRPISVVRTVPTELERQGNFSQSLLAGRTRTIYDPYTSVLGAGNVITRTPFTGNVIPSNRIDPVALKMLADIPLPNQPGHVDNWQASIYEKVDYWNLSQRVDVNLTNNLKSFVRLGIFRANLYQENPTDAGFVPLSGSNRYGMSIAGDVVWVQSSKTTVNFRGSFYNMTDEFYNPSLLLGEDGLQNYWSRNWYSSLFNSGYVYYPALDVTSGTGTNTNNRLGRQGREFYQHPDAWTTSVRVNRYEGKHNMKAGAEIRAYYGEAARFEPINLVFNSALTANTSNSPDVVNSGNQWASFMLGALDNQTTARLVPLQNPTLRGYAAYFQDDFSVTDKLTLNLGLRWEYEPGPTDPDGRLSQRIDLTQPIPEMNATPPPMNAQATTLMASKGYKHIYNGAWIFATDDNPHAWQTPLTNFLPRVGGVYRLDDRSVIRAAYARYLMPSTGVRDTLGDFVEQYAGYAQVTNTLGLSNGVPRQTLSDPYPTGVNPLIEPYGQTYGRYTNLGGAANLDEYELRPQINDRFNVSYQREVGWKTVVDLNYFFNLGTRVPFDKDLNMMDPAFRYELKAGVNVQVPNPFRNYLTADKFPGQLRNSTTVTLASLLRPYPQYTSLIQRNTNGRQMRTHTMEVRAQRAFADGLSFMVAYAYNNEKRQEWFDDIAQYKIFTTGEGWEWRPTDLPRHRIVMASTWQLPIGKDRAFLNNMPAPLDYLLGGWQVTATARHYSGRLLLFNAVTNVSGNPKLDNPTRDKWFDTTKFSVADAFAPRSNPWYFDGLTGPSVTMTDLTLTKSVPVGQNRIEARLEAYNLFDSIIWDNPDLGIASANFGKVTRKRLDGNGRELQIGLRFVF
jgi:Carboxypeptidase regulatory-like domain/TonB dependent receptor